MIMNQLQEVLGTEPWGPFHILLMEDELSMANGLKMVLQEEGYDVDLAMTGQTALDKFNRKSFDLLVADLRLPDIDGMEVIKQVKEMRPEIEAIVITGYPSVSSAVESVRIGVYDYLRKPFTEDELKEAVGGALKKREEASLEEILIRSEKERLIQKSEVIAVLNRASEDLPFWHDLMEKGSEALKGYRLSLEAKGAIVSGDLNWIRQHAGELTKDQLRFIYKRLEREAW
jgi:DNA-binding response OmpR family regulator